MIDAQAQFLRETGKTEVRFNEFFGWLQDRGMAKEKIRNKEAEKMDLKDIELKDSEFMTAKEKKMVLKQWERFLRGGMAEKDFSKRIYEHLYLHCSFIAHYDQHGFYGTFFTDPEQSIEFLHHFDTDFGGVNGEYRTTWWVEDEYGDINSEMCKIADKYKAGLYERLESEARSGDIEMAKMLLGKHGISVDLE